MKKKHLQEMTDWLEIKLKSVNTVIEEARADQNYGREAMYSGMRDAFMECLRKISLETMD